MQLVLRSARRLEREIEAEIQLQSGKVQTRGVDVSIYGDFDATIEKVQAENVSRISLIMKLMDIRYSIRKAIETKNEVSGLNTKINLEALLKAKAKLLTDLVGAELTEAERLVAQKRFEALQSSGPINDHYGRQTDTVNVPHILSGESVAVYNAQAKDVQRTLLKLVDESTSVNTSVTIDVSDDDIAFLEANGFVL